MSRAGSLRVPFGFAPSGQLGTFHTEGWLPPIQIAIRMHLDVAVAPNASPRRVVDERRVCAPLKVGNSPSPRTRSRGDSDVEAKADRSADDKSRWRLPDPPTRYTGDQLVQLFRANKKADHGPAPDGPTIRSETPRSEIIVGFVFGSECRILPLSRVLPRISFLPGKRQSL